MVHKCFLILEVVCNVGDSKSYPLKLLIMKEASVLFLQVEVRNVERMQWPMVIGPILGRTNTNTFTVVSVEFILGWSRSQNII